MNQGQKANATGNEAENIISACVGETTVPARQALPGPTVHACVGETQVRRVREQQFPTVHACVGETLQREYARAGAPTVHACVGETLQLVDQHTRTTRDCGHVGQNQAGRLATIDPPTLYGGNSPEDAPSVLSSERFGVDKSGTGAKHPNRAQASAI